MSATNHARSDGWTVTLLEADSGNFGVHFFSDRHPSPHDSRAVLNAASRGEIRVGKSFPVRRPGLIRKAVEMVFESASSPSRFAAVFRDAAARVQGPPNAQRVGKSATPTLARLVADLRARGPA